MPLISICIPAYNCERYIQETLNCLLAQTYQAIEIIVVNDGSTDRTLEQAQKISDHRIRIISVEKGGAARARNMAYHQASGQYIIFFDADDYVRPDFIQQQLAKISGHENAVVLSGWGRFYGDNLTSFQIEELPAPEMTLPDWIKLYWRNCNPMTTPGRAIIPVSIIEAAGLWNEGLSLNDDLEFFTRIFFYAEKIIFNGESPYYYRSGINGLSGSKSDDAWKSLFNSIDLSTRLILSRYDDMEIKQCCANMWQSFLYLIYPFQKQYFKTAENKIRELPRPSFKFPASGYTRYLVFLAGWKLTKKIKILYITS